MLNFVLRFLSYTYLGVSGSLRKLILNIRLYSNRIKGLLVGPSFLQF